MPRPDGPFSIMVAGPDLEFRTFQVADASPTGRQILSLYDATPFDEHVVLQWLPEGDVEELRSDETADLSVDIPAKFIVAKSDRLYRLVLDDRSVSWPTPKISVLALKTLGQISADAELYLRRENEADQLIDGDAVRLTDSGVENIYSKRGVWKLNVQGVEIESAQPMIGVRAAIVEAGLNPDQGWIIVLKTASAKRQVTLEDTIDLREPGIEKLRLTPREINNGEKMAQPIRQFSLMPTDEAGLDARKLRWETVIDQGRRWLLLQGYPMPPGFTAGSATVAVEVPSNYPAAELDMFYCFPILARDSGHAIPQTESRQQIGDNAYQRWSRHRGPNAPWRMGVDSVLTHLALIDAALAREVEA